MTMVMTTAARSSTVTEAATVAQSTVCFDLFDSGVLRGDAAAFCGAASGSGGFPGTSGTASHVPQALHITRSDPSPGLGISFPHSEQRSINDMGGLPYG